MLTKLWLYGPLVALEVDESINETMTDSMHSLVLYN